MISQALSAHQHVPWPRRAWAWLLAHKQRLAYALIACAMAIAVGAGTYGGFLLHRSAVIQRQTLRTQQLARAAFQLHDFLSRAQTANAVSPRLTDARSQALAATNTAFGRIRIFDPGEADRIHSAYVAYIAASTRTFDRAATHRGQVSIGEQRNVEQLLTQLEARIDTEIEGQARAARVANPQARLWLILAAVAVGFLVGVLIWQFEMQRRAGRIDRDDAARSEDLVRMRDEFVAAVSHELRTPLTSIMGYLDLARDNEFGERTPDQDAFLAVVQRNAERLLQLVSDLLLVAEMQDRQLKLDLHSVDLAEIAADCVETAKPSADAKRIEFELRSGPSGPLEGDPVRLAQMMDNLVSNAIKFTPVGGHVTVTTGTRDGDASLAVTDSGTGISSADQAQLFERFFRTRAATTAAIQGTGLGLAITKAIVDAHGGTIAVESSVGRGTTFRVRLPREPQRAGTTA